MFDEKYYQDKKEKIVQKVAVSKNRVIQRIIDELNIFLSQQQEYQQEMNDLEEIRKKELEKKEEKKK